MLTHDEALAKDVDWGYSISLNKVLQGKKVVDVVGHVRKDYSEYYFMVDRLVFDDGTVAYLQGEHDDVYLHDVPDAYDTLKNIFHTDPDNIDEEDDSE